MPELPEVETIVRDLRPELVGRRLAAVRSGEKALRRPWNTDWEATLVGKQVETVWRRGKWAVVSLADDLRLVRAKSLSFLLPQSLAGTKITTQSTP